MGWIVPPECQGQIVEVAYCTHYDSSQRAYRRIHDRSDGEVTYQRTDASELDDDEWDPANVEPSIDREDWEDCDEPDAETWD